MTPSLKGVDAKLARAETHVDNLEQQIVALTGSEPYSVLVKKDSHEGRPVRRLVAVKNPNVEPPPLPMVQLAGQALYQLRSTLDHLVHQLIEAEHRGHVTILK